MSASEAAILAGIAAACLVFFSMLVVSMLVVSMRPLSNWPAKQARRGDVEPGHL